MSAHESVIVCQIGFRRRYMVAVLLNELNMLEALYTDTCSLTWLGKFAKLPIPMPRIIKQLLNRKIPESITKKTRGSDFAFLRSKFHSKKSIQDIFDCNENMLAPICMKWGTGNATAVYTMTLENNSFSQAAAAKGLKTVIDINANPMDFEIFQEERKKFSNIFHSGNLELEENYYQHKIRHYLKACDSASVLLCPSRWVADHVRIMSPENASKIKIFPYGSSIDFNGRKNIRKKGHFFFAGGNWLGKGVYYLAKAVSDIKKQYPEVQCRVAGLSRESCPDLPEFDSLNFLGRLNKQQMQDEFLNADAFVFPTLSEGQAAVILEAFAAGCPVITTNACGIDSLKDHVNSLIVPSCDSDALQTAMLSIYRDNDLRALLVKNAEQCREQYSMVNWKKNLKQLFTEL